MPRTILVIEDEPGTRETIQSILKKAEYDVILASNGQEGLQKLLEKMPDLIITDFVMPEMDGFTFFKKLRSNEVTEHIPIIMLTERDKTQDSFEVAGIDCFLASKRVGESCALRQIERAWCPAFWC